MFANLATQNHRTAPHLHDPVGKFENKWLVRGLVRLTVMMNTYLYSVFHAREECDGLNWEEYFDNTENLYFSLRWLADYRNLFWLWVLYWVCWFIYWIGMHM